MKKPNIPTANAETRENAIRAIAMMIGEVNTAIKLGRSRTNPSDKLVEMGFEPVNSSIFYGDTYKKNGLTFSTHYYSGSCVYDLSWGFYYGVNKWCHFSDLEKNIDEIIARGFKTDYVRSAETTALLETIKEKVAETKKLVDGKGLGEIGGMLRNRGYFVSYDGFSVCNFSKDGIIYSAHCDGRWLLTDSYEVYLANGKMSSSFSLYGGKSTDGDKFFEVVVGHITKLGRRETEQDLLPSYKKFRVRTYASKYLETIATFTDFEEAKKFAYDTAVEKANNVSRDLRMYANTNPRDCGEDYDMLACFVWYKYDRGSEHLVFVQGE